MRNWGDSDEDLNCVSEASSLIKHYPISNSLVERLKKTPKRKVHALNGVDLKVYPGEAVGIIGESGSGKSTLGRLLLRLEPPTAGRVTFEGRDLALLRGEELRQLRRNMGMVFQNPYSAVNRRWSVMAVVREPLEVQHIGTRSERDVRTLEALTLVGFPREVAKRRCSDLSGGQLQRVVIARAIVTKPHLIVADEPTASLDISVRAQVINLFADLRAELGLSLVFISHDLGTVSYLADRSVVLYVGRIMEMGVTDEIEREPLHPYTKALIDSIPIPDPRQRQQAPDRGEIPSPVSPPQGCPYHPRCLLAKPRCNAEIPVLEEKRPEHWVACWEVPATAQLAPPSSQSVGKTSRRT
jgi:oligopeptide/dipeptide ABC transporter ATP-binding protein